MLNMISDFNADFDTPFSDSTLRLVLFSNRCAGKVQAKPVQPTSDMQTCQVIIMVTVGVEKHYAPCTAGLKGPRLGGQLF